MKCLAWGTSSAGRGSSEVGTGHCTPRHSGHLPLCLLTEPPGILRALSFKNLDVTKSNWKFILVLLPLFLPFLPSLTPALGLQLSVLRKSEPHHCHSSPVCRACRTLDATKCEIWPIHRAALGRTPALLACCLQIFLASLCFLARVMTGSSVFYMQGGHFCLSHQKYTVAVRVRRSLAVSLLLMSDFSKGTANNLCLQRERHWHEESHWVAVFSPSADFSDFQCSLWALRKPEKRWQMLL